MVIKTYHGAEITPHINALAQLRITVFREYPYLYSGSLDYEKNYLKTYVNSPSSIAVLVFDESRIVGASTGLPLKDETQEFKKPFEDHMFDIESIFYCGESILLKPYRGRGLYSEFFSRREKHAATLELIDKITFCSVSRPENHPLKPRHYRPLNPVWEKFGYKEQPHLNTRYTWQDVNEQDESPKKMVFWLKKL